MKSSISLLFRAWQNVSLLLIVSSVIVVAAFLFSEASTFLALLSNDPPAFLLSSDWFPSEGKFGLLALVVATLAILALAIFLSAILAAACAFGTVLYAHQKLRVLIIAFFECAASLPPVVVGLCGLTVLVPMFAKKFEPGFGILSSAIVLAVLLIPSMACHWMTLIQKEHEEKLMLAKSLNLGNTCFMTRILWPALRGFFLRSLVLYAQRGMAETLAIVMVSGNVVRIPQGLFEPVRTINSTIALEIPYAEGMHRSALFFLSLTAFCIALSLSVSLRTARLMQALSRAHFQNTTFGSGERI